MASVLCWWDKLNSLFLQALVLLSLQIYLFWIFYVIQCVKFYTMCGNDFIKYFKVTLRNIPFLYNLSYGKKRLTINVKEIRIQERIIGEILGKKEYNTLFVSFLQRRKDGKDGKANRNQKDSLKQIFSSLCSMNHLKV